MISKLNYEGLRGIENPHETALRIYDEICQENNKLTDDIKNIDARRIENIKKEMNGKLSIKGLAGMVAQSGFPYAVVDLLEDETSDASEEDKLKILAIACKNEAKRLTREAQWSSDTKEKVTFDNEAEIYMKKAVYLEAGLNHI